MEGIKNTELPDYRWMFSVSEDGGDKFSWKSPIDDYVDREVILLPAENDLPPDHLTATYWG
jgi:hypothetical protein